MTRDQDSRPLAGAMGVFADWVVLPLPEIGTLGARSSPGLEEVWGGQQGRGVVW